MKRLFVLACALFGVSVAHAGAEHWNDFSQSQKHLRHSPGGESRGYVPPGGHWNDLTRSQDYLRNSGGNGSGRYVPPGGHWNDFSKSQKHLRGHGKSARAYRASCEEARYGSRLWHECRSLGY